MERFRKFAALLLLLVLPLQGVAAVLAPLHCAPQDAQAVAVHPSHDHQGGTHQPSSAPETDHEYSGHLCCHHVFSGAAASATRTVTPAPMSVQPVIVLLVTLFIPDLPLQPPRG